MGCATNFSKTAKHLHCQAAHLPTPSGFWPAASAPGVGLAAKYLVQNSILAWLSFTSSPSLAFLGTMLKRQQIFQKQSEASISLLREV